MTDAEQPAPTQKPKKIPAAAIPKAPTATVSKASGPRYIGIDVKPPTDTCTDQFCPFHGILPVRGQILEGTVMTDGMQSTVVVKRIYMRKIQKYERFEKRSNKYLVHSPPCLGIGVGDSVKIMECRPLSKLVSFVVIEKMDRE
ncbi:MAG: 30S ribosomal protein S17 [Candidatus Thermoplasmatota archaeon]|nr:30S ribosomal protein S17 [Euryarchaeota archaeon]MBU4031937.1 30S ribosomal protein S17 [Candidatus Thermoplasmatota archaeon]MBU4072479.1 30S ribosomal protein S17 [Candidatus Thermoplasmatota archaeon]MBU4144177.1 30S ribosomal protein S17 [Candidatus Thermoplasmatota archaeon]MBU4592811.1 30S ribosomal protein S17 [Candidatus Thermoplasmatota archaeon]